MRRAWIGLLPVVLAALVLGLCHESPQMPATEGSATSSARLATLINDLAQQEAAFDRAAIAATRKGERASLAQERASRVQHYAVKMLDLARHAPDQAVVVEALTRIVASGGEGPEAREAAERLKRDWLASPTLASAAERLGKSGSAFAEASLRATITASPHPRVRGFSELALATLLMERTALSGWVDSPSARSQTAEAGELLRHVLASSGDLSDARGRLADLAQERLDALAILRSGLIAMKGRASGTPYVGVATCRECHPGEAAMYARSGHGRTLRPAAAHELARTLAGRVIEDPESPEVNWRFALRGDELSVERRQAGETERFLIDYAFGSGHHAVTLVSLRDPSIPTALEHRLSYFHDPEGVRITPGQGGEQEIAGLTPHGRELSPETTRQCFGCHSTSITPRGRQEVDLATMLLNVSCERCHGPGLAHVEAARHGNDDLTMPMGAGEASAQAVIRLCGQCHRSPAQTPANAIRADDSRLARFQPIGLTQSQCYRQSGGALTCVTCHDPHARASTDRASYEAACLTCHANAPQAVCRESRRSGCIDCHMPRVDTGQHVLFTDHWIRVRR